MTEGFEEGICEYYKDCKMREIELRDCTKPAYEDCETYKSWKKSLDLGIGAMTVPLNLGGAEISTKEKLK